MPRKREQFLQDIGLIIISLYFALYTVEAGLVHKIVDFFEGIPTIGILLSGAFFTSVFTTAPAIVLLGAFAKTESLWLVSLVGGVGAVLGDYLIFRLVKDRVAEDLAYIFSISRKKRLPHIFRTGLFRFLVPLVGGIIIASPLPDELGVFLLGMAKVPNRVFFPISFIFNTFGIFIIGLLARSLAGL